MAQTPCYNGPNPIKDEERPVIWKWAKESGGIDDGMPIEHVANAVNIKFYGGMAKPEWIDDLLSGRKTPLRQVANDMWRKQYNRRVATQQAQEIRQIASLGPAAKWLRRLWTAPRTVAVAGHGVVFPITHAGDLAFRPASWGTFIQGTLRTYHGAFSKAYTGRMLNMIERDPLYDTALRSGVDVGAGSHPSGLISRTYRGPAQRAWDMLTVMRFELWKKQMGKFITPGMAEAEVNEIGANLAEWANHATGSAKGPLTGRYSGDVLFGPKLTQSKISRVFADPAQTINTFAHWDTATAGEKAVAWTRLSGAAQFVGTNLGFLAVNQGLNMALAAIQGQSLKPEENINVTDPMKGDFMAFKGGGILGYMPGLHTEVRTLAKILATAFASKQELRGESKFGATAKIAGQYGMGKLAPTIERGLEVGFGQNWMGRPLPWSGEPGTERLPKMSYGEYAGEIGPIPLSGPIGYVYDQLKQGGASVLDATAITKALIITGLGAPGIHVREDFPPKAVPTKTPVQAIRSQHQQAAKAHTKALRERLQRQQGGQ